jgi:hypothetical protein
MRTENMLSEANFPDGQIAFIASQMLEGGQERGGDLAPPRVGVILGCRGG